MRKLSKEEAIKLHREMWEWIAEEETRKGMSINYNNRVELKTDWLYDHGYDPDDIFNSCFLCEYAYQQAHEQNKPTFCRYCPLIWPDSQVDQYMCEGSGYDWRVSSAQAIARLQEVSDGKDN